MDMNLIVTAVQQHFLQKGTYLSTIFVELDGDGIEVMVIPQLDKKKYSIAERAGILLNAGRTFGQAIEKTQQRVTGLCMARLSVQPDIGAEGIFIAKMSDEPGI